MTIRKRQASEQLVRKLARPTAWWPRARTSPTSAGSYTFPGRHSISGGTRTELPGQLDLKFGAIVLDLELHLQIDAIGNARNESHFLPLDHDIIA